MTYKRSDFYDIAMTFARRAATRMKVHLHVAFLFGRGGVMLGMATNRIAAGPALAAILSTPSGLSSRPLAIFLY